MKYLKLYREGVEEATRLSEPKVDDYVVCYDESFYMREDEIADIMNNFLDNNSGQIIDIEYNSYIKNNYTVKYGNIPKEIEKYFEYVCRAFSI